MISPTEFVDQPVIPGKNTPPTDQLIINGKIYHSDENCYGAGWGWDSEKRVLSLYTYHGTAISCFGNLTIITSGAENSISCRHGPAIHVRNGDLIIRGDGPLTFDDCETGIFVEMGKLRLISIHASFSVGKCGINADGSISVSDSAISIQSKDTGMKTGAESGIIIDRTSVHIIAETVGIDCAGNFSFDGGGQIIETPRGTGLLVRLGSCSLKNGFYRAACKEFGIYVKDGDLNIESLTAEISAGTGIFVNGSFFGKSLNLFLNGEEIGLHVCGNTCSLTSGSCAVSGNIALSLDNNLILSQMNVTADGERIGISAGGSYIQEKSCVSVSGGEEIAVSIGTNMTFSGPTLNIRGYAGLLTGGNLDVLDGSITAVDEETAIEVRGTFVQRAGMIRGTGMNGDGIRVSKKMEILGGRIDAAGSNTGLTALEDFTIRAGLMTASGKTGIRAEGAFSGEGGYLTSFGDEFGLYVSGSNTVFGDIVADIAGDIAVYIRDSLNICGGALQISGHYAGIFSDNGDILFANGMHDITADTYGIFIKSGSVYARGGTLGIRNTHNADNSCGICLDSGDFYLTGAQVTITGGTDGVRGDKSRVSVFNSGLMSEGEISGISVQNLHFMTGMLTAYGRKEALSLLSTPVSEYDTVTVCGKSRTSHEPGPYANQKYVHLYPKHSVRLIIPAAVESLDEIVQWVDAALRPNGITESVISRMTLVIEELFVNIVNYAYPNEPGSVTFTLYLDSCLKLIISDTGVPFNPLESAEPDLSVPIDDRKIGGWGIFLSRKLTDKITYERVNGTNILTVYKQLYTECQK